jgi:hypothetical protein
MRTIAEQRGGKCLSEKYVNNHTKLKWQCEKGHVWYTGPKGIKKGQWCPVCGGSLKLTIEDMQKLAEAKGGICLSNKYFNNKTHLTWQCKDGHIWDARPDCITRGRWCPKCGLIRGANVRRGTIEEMQELAKQKDGRCLSKEYIDSNTKLQWQCSKGHNFWMEPSHVKRYWCQKCAVERRSNLRRDTIEEMQELASKKEGKCLSTVYINSKTKLKWECKEGHIWDAEPTPIKQGHWCPRCAGKAKLTIEEMQELAKQKGGKCLSTEYIDNKTKLQFQCSEGHKWYATPGKIKFGRWCPRCKTPSIGERICREYFQLIFKMEFPTEKPRWLVNERGNRMELDGYCKELNLAFEYHGSQHFESSSFFTGGNLAQRKQDDAVKEMVCKQNDVTLITIPYTIQYEEMQKYIIEECKKNNVELPTEIKSVDYTTFNVYRLEKIKDMQELADSKGGKCLSEVYVNCNTKLHWRCKEGHTFLMNPNSVQQDQWCPHCAGVAKLTIEEMQEIARGRGGECLSTVYVNGRTKLKWQCKEGHTWETAPHNVKHGSWCPVCSGNISLTIQNMQELARQKNGSCLSTEYTNSNTKLKWQCKNEHIFWMNPNHVTQNHWCPKCAIKRRTDLRRGTIEEMQELARQKGGKCISTIYITSQTKLQWHCKEGHVFWMAPNNVTQGQWCRKCAYVTIANQKRKTIEDMQELASIKEGKCLSKIYTHTDTKLQWQCKYGHIWNQTPHKIKQGRWCPTCAKNRMRRPRKYNRNYKQFPHKNGF